ncbi:MAG: hypothetical protein JWO05_2016 [Gemmatimonadetes bacterium]|nr:hypothetical protein [Gemmatimonadota bacterium]
MAERYHLGVIATHPVQYNAALYRELARRVDVTVCFAHRPTAAEQGHGFGVAFEWDVDVTAGYRHLWLANRAKDPGANSFSSYDTPHVAGVIERERFDGLLLMGWHARSYLQALRAARRSRIPVFVRSDSQLGAQSSALKRMVKRLVYPPFIRRFDACLSVGARSDEYFHHYGARRVLRSPHFVDNDFFSAEADRASPERGSARARWQLPVNATVALFAGKFVEKKRPLDFVKAVAGSRDAGVVGLMVGDGELRSACEAEAARLDAPIRFAGFLNQREIPAAYAASDVLVLASDARETWGLVVNEAMASGRPAIVSEAAGCAPDLVRSGRTGFTVPLGDVRAIARHLGALAGEPGRAQAMGASARDLVHDCFSVTRAADGASEAMLAGRTAS